MRDMETEWSTLCKNLRGDSLAVSPCYSNMLSYDKRQGHQQGDIFIKEPDSPVVVIRKCIVVSWENFMVVEGFVHVCLAVSQRHPAHEFVVLAAKKLCYTINPIK